jgi:hypothetical protein
MPGEVRILKFTADVLNKTIMAVNDMTGEEKIVKSSDIVSLEVGGLWISLLVAQPSPIGDEKIRTENDPRQITFHVHRDYISDIPHKLKVFDSGSAWSIFSHGGRYFLQDNNFTSDLLPETLIMLSPDLRGGEIYLKNTSPDHSLYSDFFGYPLNQILTIILLSSRNGIVVHACGIDDGGRGYLFLGNSTNGKSTIAKLWHDRGATVLNDDRIIVRERDGVFWMYGTPWHGTFAETALRALPVEKIFFLKHGNKNRLLPKAGSKAVSMLLTRSFPTFWDRAGMEQALGLMDRMVGALPCYELHFLPDGEVIDFIRSMHQ